MKVQLISTVACLLLGHSLDTNAADTSIAAETFMNPSKTAQLSHCKYDVLTCARSSHHTALDYSKNGDRTIVSSNAGTIAKIEHMNRNDHGMGNNVIIKHELVNGSIIYSSYSHLDSILSSLAVGNTVNRGEKIGMMGGSGKGDSDAWGIHLHFELKSKNVSGAPTKPSNYWGYVPSSPDGYGYYDPNKHIGVTNVVSPLTNGMQQYNFIPIGKWKYYRIDNSNYSSAIIELSKLKDDVDLYVKKGSKPTGSNYDCRSNIGGSNSESCAIDLNSSTSIYIGVYGYRNSDYAIKAILTN